MYLEPVTVKGKTEFAAALQRWFEGDSAETIGDPGSFGGRAHVRVDLGIEVFHLNADTKRQGVRSYLDLVREQGPDLAWHVIASKGEKAYINKVAPGPTAQPIPGFYLYADEPAAAPYSL